METNPDDSHWKHKYLTSLDEHDRKEKDWKALEELLTLAMNRVAIAAEGVDQTLDRQLKSLRNALHSSHYQELASIVEDISRAVKRLDDQRGHSTDQATSPATTLKVLLDSLHFPDPLKDRVNALQSQHRYLCRSYKASLAVALITSFMFSSRNFGI